MSNSADRSEQALRAELISSVTAAEIRALAIRAERGTHGRVRFLYSTHPSTTTYWSFEGAPMAKMTRDEITTWLRKVVANPSRF